MNIINRIDKCIDKLSEGKISSMLTEATGIALELEDYRSWAFLRLQNINRKDDKNYEARKIKVDFYHKLSAHGISNEDIEKQYNYVFGQYLQSRTIGNEKIFNFPVYELESLLDDTEKKFDILTLPDNLAPIDAYYENQSYTKAKLTLQNTAKDLKDFISLLKSSIGNALIEMRQLAISKNASSIKRAYEGANMKDIFIIHGHNEAKWRELESILKNDFELNPIILSQLPNQGLTIIEKFEKHAKTCSFAFALFTPDDIIENSGKTYFQARPNVIFELGWFYAKLGRNKVCILDQESDKSAIFSDLQGIMRIQFKSNIKEVFVDIQRELISVGLI